jgi:diguanylate cyclase (GGDEF)-like protein
MLAREFREMGNRLRALEREQLDANPLTYLPGNQAIAREIEQRISAAQPFAHCYVDLDNFKVYNDRYGYEAGNEVIAEAGQIIREVVAARAGEDTLVGHIGGDDYVVLTAPDAAEEVAAGIISSFDERILAFYSDEDRAQGKLLGEDRFGVQREFPLMSISIAIVNSANLSNPTVASVSQACTALKEHLKNQPGSNYLVDRRSRP